LGSFFFSVLTVCIGDTVVVAGAEATLFELPGALYIAAGGSERVEDGKAGAGVGGK